MLDKYLKMICPIKTTPADVIYAYRYGNKGLGFPLTIPCEAVIADAEQLCYLALELGDDPVFGSPIFQEAVGLMGSGFFAAPCLSSLEDFLCYLALEEDGTTPFDTEEPSDDFFAVPCV